MPKLFDLMGNKLAPPSASFFFRVLCAFLVPKAELVKGRTMATSVASSDRLEFGSFFHTKSKIPCVSADSSDKDGELFVEVDPTGRYGDPLGAGTVKKVYRGFDQEGGCRVGVELK